MVLTRTGIDFMNHRRDVHQTWENHALSECTTQPIPVSQAMDDVSVSLSSYDPHEDYHVPSDYDFTGGEDLETKPKEKMNQRSAVTPDAHSRPTKVTRYVVDLASVLEAQVAAHETFVSYLQSKAMNFDSGHLDVRPQLATKEVMAGELFLRSTTFPSPHCADVLAEKPMTTTHNGFRDVLQDVRSKPAAEEHISRDLSRRLVTVPPPCHNNDMKSPLPESFMSVSERQQFLSIVQLNPFCASLLRSRVDNMCFFIEEPLESFDDLNTGGRLDKLGPFSMQRWEHIRAIHCIFPSRKGQAYFVRQLACTHYQEMFSQFVSAIETCVHDITVKLYYPVRDYSNEFLVLWNKPATVSPFSDAIDWSYIAVVLDHSSKKGEQKGDETSPLAKKRQARRYRDYGFTSNICTTRRHSTSGISRPVLKAGTLDPQVVTIFLAGTDAVRTVDLPWLAGDALAGGYEDLDHPNRHEQFARQIHPKNIIEACRVHGSKPKSMCGAHSDRMNSPIPTMALVVGVNLIVGDEQLGVTYYSRKSADSYLASSLQVDDFTRFVLQTYRTFPEERRKVCRELSQGKKVVGLFDIAVVTNPCNLDPSGFYQISLFLMLAMEKRFSLTIPEVVSVVAAYDIIADNPYYFYLSVRSLMSCSSRGTLPRAHRGYAFGYLLGTLMIEFYRVKKRNSLKVPGRRYATYVDPELPEKKEWIKRCDEKTLLILHVNATYPDMTNKGQCCKVYRDILKKFSKNILNMGDLRTNHSLAIMSALGLLPSWIRQHADISPTTRYMKWFSDHYPLPRPLNYTKLERVIATLGRALAHEFGREFTIRELENILCKVFRVINDGPSDRLFGDILVPLQNLFLFNKTTVKILNPRTAETQLVDGTALINRWMLGDSYLSMKEIVDVLGIRAQMPTETSLVNIKIPAPLFDGRWDIVNDEIELSDATLLEARKELTTVYNRVSRQLRK